VTAARRLGAVATLAAALCAGTARGDDVPAGRGPLETRVVSVASLTRGFIDFRMQRRGAYGLLAGPETDAVPLFGAEGEESVKPWGTIDEILDLVRSPDPATWTDEKAWASARGTTHLLLRAPAAALDAAEDLVARMEGESLRTVFVDLLVLEGDPASVAGGGVLEAVSRGRLRVVGGARATGHAGQAVFASAVRQAAYVGHQDVEVADGARISDPIVETLVEGVGLSAVPTFAGDVLRLDVHAWSSRLLALDRLETAISDGVERPTFDVRVADARSLAVTPGEWRVVGSSGRTTFAVRARVEAPPPRARTSALPTIAAGTAPGPLVFATRDVSDLAQRFQNHLGPAVVLYPSAYTPPEPPGLPEPVAYVFEEDLRDLTMRTLDPEHWTRDGVEWNVVRTRIEIRADAAHLAAFDALLAELRRRFLRFVRVEARAVSVPAAALLAHIDRDRPPALARQEAFAVVHLPLHGRDAAAEGTWRAYLGDHDVEIAAKAAIGNPIVKRAFEGLVLDAHVVAVANGAAVDVDLRLDRSSDFASRRVATVHGDLACPRMHIQTARGSLVVPVGQTRLASVAIDGDRATLIYVSVLSE
jgi:hypothetical protein